MSSRTPKLFVISGPSGAGKGTLVAQVRERLPHLGLAVSATTRAPRAGEIDGVTYHFLTDDEFTRRVDNGDFLEWAQVHDHRYGTLVSEVERNLDAGRSLILEIDVQGALAVKRRFPSAVLIFIEPPSLEILRERLVGRGSETEESLALRMADAEEELKVAGVYGARLVNDDLARATDELVETLTSYERC
ncbi:guanylate kinase [Collinsella vaginalis]|uniref:guanylate kinase n=1 Tax=Collinsella vaginalis TaxID=1870987 RepID=UPI000A26BE7F|nr:guanylate kinase [Collinsella vaginalis]